MSEARAAGVPERVDVGAIERELHRLWSSLDEEGAPGAGGNAVAQVTRICTLTLLAVVRDGRAADAAAIAARLGARYPSRSIVLDLSPGGGDRLAAEVALNCHTPGTPRPTVCCEQLRVSASGRSLARVPGLVLPLLVPDLPVYVWWSGDLPSFQPAAPEPEADVLRRLAEVADALIIDSSAMRRPTIGLRTAVALTAPLSGGLRDLSWGRLTPWRDLVVQCFDPAPMRQALERLDRIRIRTAPGAASSSADPADPIAGLLLGGWVAGRLGWEPAGPTRREGGVLRALFWREGGGLELSVEGGAGPVLSIECTAGGAEPCAVSIIRQSDGPDDMAAGGEAGRQSSVRIETRLGRGRARTTAAGLPLADDTALIGAEFEVSGVDHILREALEIVLRVTQGSS